MGKLCMILANVFLLIAIINCDYKVTEKFYGGFHAELTISVTEDIANGWKLELTFDDKVKLQIHGGGVVDSNKDEKVYIIVNDSKSKSLTKGTNHLIKWMANFDNDAGANLIRATFQGKNLNLGAEVPHISPVTIAPIGTKGNYNYGTVLHASLLFYEAQRSGKLPKDNRIDWRGDSMLHDKGDNGEDLTGGYHDAGDLVKFNFPMAYAITVSAWGAIDYEDSFVKSGELNNVHKMIKWGTDYFLKCHVKENELYGQVGNGATDHAVWGRPEDWPANKPRPAYKITATAPGADLAGETAAAMAAASIVFKKSDATYSAKLLKNAEQLYAFADQHRGNYSDSIKDAAAFYKSWSGFGDELGWAAAWLWRATNQAKYKSDVEKHWSQFNLGSKGQQFSWDDKKPGLQALMAKITKEEKYKKATEDYVDWVIKVAPKSPKGMVYLDQWGPLRHAANAALVALQAADAGINAAEYRKFAESQIGYILGDTGRSYVVGIGVNPPLRPHHRAASCPNRPAGCDYWAFQSPAPNPHILTGALVGGPGQSDNYSDKRDDFVHNEVAMDYNAGFQSAVAGLLHLKNKALL